MDDQSSNAEFWIEICANLTQNGTMESIPDPVVTDYVRISFNIIAASIGIPINLFGLWRVSKHYRKRIYCRNFQLSAPQYI